MANDAPQNRFRRLAPIWLAALWLPLVAVIAVTAALDVDRLHDAARERQRVSELLADVEASAYSQRLGLAKLAAGEAGPRAVRAVVAPAAARAASDVAQLQELDSDGEQAETAALVTRFQRAVSHELARSARDGPGFTLAAGAVDRPLRLLTRTLRTARPRERAEADATETAAHRREVTVALIALAGVLVPLVAIFHLRRRTRRLAMRRRRLEQSEQRFRALVQNASDTILVVAGDGTIRSAHGAAGSLLRSDPDALVGTPLWDIVHPDDRLLARAVCENAAGGGAETAEWRLAHVDGSWSHCEVAIADLSRDPAVRGLVLTLRDVSRRKELEDQLRHRAFHDPLTQLPNRALFLDRAEHALARERRDGGGVAVLFLDLDNFKLVNDRLGHAVGDELLVDVAQRLRACVRSVDTAARLGGDEFGILIEDVIGASEAVQAAERVLAALAGPFTFAAGRHELGACLGISVSQSGDVADELMRRADVAMYAAKAHGSGRYELFDSALESAFGADAAADERITFFMRSEEQRAEVEALLARPDAPTMVVQPLIDLRTGLVAGYEALARFPGSDRPPNAWFAQAHRHGLGCQLEARALERAIALTNRPADTFLTVNLSPTALISPEVWAVLPDDLAGIVIEVTENELASRGDSLGAALDRLRGRGALLAVDDAGAGYAGLKQLMHLGPEIIKLDRTLVADAARHPTKAALIESFARYAARTGAQVCAEGVEAIDELKLLAELDVTFAQGYAIARPGEPWPAAAPEAQAACGFVDSALTRAPAAKDWPESASTLWSGSSPTSPACASEARCTPAWTASPPASAPTSCTSACSTRPAPTSRRSAGSGARSRACAGGSWTFPRPSACCASRRRARC